MSEPPPPAPRSATRSSDLTFPALDGYSLAGTLFPAEEPRGAVVVAAAMGVRRRFYAPFAAFLAAGGLTTLTFDYRGIGDSRRGSLRGFAGALHDWGELDLAAALRWMKERSPHHSLQLVSHSVGGQVFGLIDDPPVDGAVFVASQSGSWRLWSGLPRLGMWLFWHLLLPALTRIFGYLPMRLFGQGEDLPPEVAREWADWGRRDDYVWSYAAPRGGRGFRRWRGPLVAFAIADDGYAPRAGVAALADLYTAADREVRPLEPAAFGQQRIGHFGAFRPGVGEAIWAEIRGELLYRATGADETPNAAP